MSNITIAQEKMQGCKVVEKEKAIEALNSEVIKQKEEIEKYSKLMAMFHNLSSGQIPQR